MQQERCPFFILTAEDSNDRRSMLWSLNLSGIGMTMKADSISAEYGKAECFTSTEYSDERRYFVNSPLPPSSEVAASWAKAGHRAKKAAAAKRQVFLSNIRISTMFCDSKPTSGCYHRPHRQLSKPSLSPCPAYRRGPRGLPRASCSNRCHS